VFVTDDSLVAPLLAGLERARVRVRRDVHVLAHCTWPRPLGVAEGVEHIGFDAREVLAAAKESLDAQRGGARFAGPRRAPALRPRGAHRADHAARARSPHGACRPRDPPARR